ncbi:hypothetical protein CM49_00557 [Paenibacillus sp. P1XP2]|nr:hypothetical protein CM49_00557 [Paenibacillus sp. P1XP2]
MFVSMKSVEMQIAIPRTTEAGRIQNDIHHRTSQEQEFLAGQQQKEAQELRQKSAGVDETANARCGTKASATLRARKILHAGRPSRRRRVGTRMRNILIKGTAWMCPFERRNRTRRRGRGEKRI